MEAPLDQTYNTMNGHRSFHTTSSASGLVSVLMLPEIVNTSMMLWDATGFVFLTVLSILPNVFQNMPANYDAGVFENCHGDDEFVFHYLWNCPDP